jgi:hypothetical protein
MCVSECTEGTELLEAATQTSAGSEAREAFLEHIRHCGLCKASDIQDCIDALHHCQKLS